MTIAITSMTEEQLHNEIWRIHWLIEDHKWQVGCWSEKMICHDCDGTCSWCEQMERESLLVMGYSRLIKRLEKRQAIYNGLAQLVRHLDYVGMQRQLVRNCRKEHTYLKSCECTWCVQERVLIKDTTRTMKACRRLRKRLAK